jgi:hypothetical protein
LGWNYNGAVHRRDTENAEGKFFARSGDADLVKGLRLTGSFSNQAPVLRPQGLKSFGFRPLSGKQKVYFLCELSVSNDPE